jgi:hypothetical protein
VNVERRDALLKQYPEPFREVDRLIISVGGGVLALSIALISQVDDKCGLIYIQGAWIAILLAIGCVLGSLIGEQFDTKRRLDQIEDGKKETDGLSTAFVKGLNWCGIGLFAAGLILVTIFLFIQTS